MTGYLTVKSTDGVVEDIVVNNNKIEMYDASKGTFTDVFVYLEFSRIDDTQIILKEKYNNCKYTYLCDILDGHIKDSNGNDYFKQ